MHTADVVIAGGGIIGLSTALELASAGLRVTILERGRAMQESSWAAAGMLAADDPENPAELRPLSQMSRRLYPGYLDRIRMLSGLSVPLRTHSTLQCSRAGEVFDLEELPGGKILSRSEAEELLSGVGGWGRDFLLLEEASLDPRDLCTALPRAVSAAGVALHEGSPVLEVRASSNEVDVKTAAGSISAGHFVNCCGAWASQIREPASPEWLPLRCGLEAPIQPRKGQMLMVEMNELLPCALRSPEVYLVPRGSPHDPQDRRIVIGATVEDTGFDKQVRPEASQWLFDHAVELWPPLKRASMLNSWVGLRPATADSLPAIGPVPGLGGGSRYWSATGHFRNGILLAPATALVVSRLIQGLSVDTDLTPFKWSRFLHAKAPVPQQLTNPGLTS